VSSPDRGRTIILGHTGFLGRALQDYLVTQGVAVHGYSSKTLDLRSSDALRALDPHVGPDTTLIVAAALTPDKGVTLDALADNFAMVANVARYLEAHAVRKCVYFSSDAVYPFGAEPVSERSAADPENFYALAKFVGERVLRRAAEAQGFPVLVVRPTGVYGPGDTHNSYGPNRFVRSIVRERTVRLFGKGTERRDHLYVGDFCRIVGVLSASEVDGVVNLATGSSRSFASIVDALRALVPYEFSVVSLPQRTPVTHRRFDVTRLCEALPGVHFTPFEEGLEATFAAAAGQPT